MSDVIETLVRLKTEADLTMEEVARALRVDPLTVGDWKEGKQSPRATTKRVLVDLDAVVMRAREYMTKEEVWAWLHRPHPYLDNKIPLDAFANDYDERVLHALEAWSRPG